MPKKLNLSQRQIKAVQDSIEHWKEDIEKPLMEGEKIYNCDFELRWKSSAKLVKYREDSCALCKIVKSDCSDCPYCLFYGQACDEYDQARNQDGYWRKFRRNPNLRTARAMIRALERIIAKEE
jgi:hypothetical protein